VAHTVRIVQNRQKKEAKEANTSEFNEMRRENQKLRRENKRLRRELEKRFEPQYNDDKEEATEEAPKREKTDSCLKCESLDLVTLSIPTGEIIICKNCHHRRKK
jgi:hypothetical protein